MTHHMDEAAPETLAHQLQEELINLGAGLISGDRESVETVVEMLGQIGDLAVSLEKDLKDTDTKLLSLESDETDQRDDVAIEIENRVYFTLAKVVDFLTGMSIEANENKGENV
jgi:hypothetical protein